MTECDVNAYLLTRHINVYKQMKTTRMMGSNSVFSNTSCKQ